MPTVSTTVECPDCCEEPGTCADAGPLACNGFALQPGTWRATVTASANWVRVPGGPAVSLVDWCGEFCPATGQVVTVLEPGGSGQLPIRLRCCTTFVGSGDPFGFNIADGGGGNVGANVGGTPTTFAATDCSGGSVNLIPSTVTHSTNGSGEVDQIVLTAWFVTGASPEPTITVVFEPGECVVDGEEPPGGGGEGLLAAASARPPRKRRPTAAERAEAVRRVRLPCVHLGERLPGRSCGNAVYHCRHFGDATRPAGPCPQEAARTCQGCGEYVPPPKP